jgi:hypothetical protein
VERRTNGLFNVSDFSLNPEVQQMITYYDDLNLYGYEAHNLGSLVIVNSGY